MSRRKQILGWALLVFVITAGVFAPVLKGQFLNWDDDVLLVENPYFRGFSAAHWRWMCTTNFYGHWQPLSWLSYAIDHALWGMDPAPWHATNGLLHALNSALVFALCLQLGSDRSRRAECVSAFLAALFYSIHPLRVEPVAWLATRGYLLGTTFSLVSIWFYVRCVNRARAPLGSLFFFALSAATKGICMMLPLGLLLIDWIPLRRLNSWRSGMRCGLEKIPFLGLSALTGALAFWAKQSTGGMAAVENYGFGARIAQAVYGAWFYLLKTVSPQRLSPLYIHRPEPWAVVGAFVLTLIAALLFAVFHRRLRALWVALGAFLVLIFPMLGFTQSGAQLFADRFTYLAAVPISILLAAGLARLKRFRRLVLGAGVVLLLLFGVQSSIACRSWQSNLTLWKWALELDPNNPQAHNSAGLALKQMGHYARAQGHFERAIELNATYVQAWHNRSVVLAILGQTDAALKGWDIAEALQPLSSRDRMQILWVRGWVREQQGDCDAALADYTAALQDPGALAHLRARVLLLRAGCYARAGRPERARADARAALQLPDPFGQWHAEARELIQSLASP